MLSHGDMLKLGRWNTPTIYNGWERVTKCDPGRDCFNRDETHDFMPQMGPMVGRAITLLIEPGNREHGQKQREAGRVAWLEYLDYVMSVDGPKIVVVQDLDKPLAWGSFWGEVSANSHRALGCVGVICDGAIRDVDEMANAGFKALARRLCVGHAYTTPVSWGEPVECFGVRVEAGQLIHADKHGFLAIPNEDEAGLLEAARFLDDNECNSLLPAARGVSGQTREQMLAAFRASITDYTTDLKTHFGGGGDYAAPHSIPAETEAAAQ